MPAVAVTDTNNMYAALEFSVAATGAGVQPIVGCQVDLAFAKADPGQRPPDPAPIVLSKNLPGPICARNKRNGT